MGYDGVYNPDSFVWSVPDGAKELVDYEDAGNTFSVRGIKNGTVKVTVPHPLATKRSAN